MKIEVDHVIADKIVVESLRASQESLKNDILYRPKCGVFDKDKTKDLTIMLDYLSAIETVMDYYGVEQ